MSYRSYRTLDATGRASDGQPILAGDVFRTLSGRITTAYPKLRHARQASLWLIENAVAEAGGRGDELNACVFSGETPLKTGHLPPASVASMLGYLFDWQPDVHAKFLRPLVASAGTGCKGTGLLGLKAQGHQRAQSSSPVQLVLEGFGA